MSENLRKLIGVAVMAAIVVVGVVVTNGDDSDSSRTRNVAFGLPKGAGLDAQVQQPGDAENDLVIAMAAAAKCEEGHGLISTGDPVSPWRCGPLLSEMATVGIEDRVSRIESALQGNSPVANESAELAQDLDDHLMAESLRRQRQENWRDLFAGYVGFLVRASGFLIGVEVEVARAAVLQIGLGFEHNLADGEATGEIERRGTWRDERNSATIVGVSTLNGIVETVQNRDTPGN